MRHRQLHKQSTVLHLLNSTRNLITTNPLDRIYALMGMPPFIKMRPPLAVDYGKSKPDLYRELAISCIRETERLNILGYVNLSMETKSFPSWIPESDRRDPDVEYMIDHPPTRDCTSCGETSADISIDFENSVLKGNWNPIQYN